MKKLRIELVNKLMSPMIPSRIAVFDGGLDNEIGSITLEDFDRVYAELTRIREERNK